jgi:hypothetical protein
VEDVAEAIAQAALLGGVGELLDGRVGEIQQRAVRRGSGASFSGTSSFCGVALRRRGAH